MIQYKLDNNPVYCVHVVRVSVVQDDSNGVQERLLHQLKRNKQTKKSSQCYMTGLFLANEM